MVNQRMRFEWRVITALVLIGLCFWLPRGIALDRFVTTDEVIWLLRSANFYYNLSQRNLSATFSNPSPGITTLWVETTAFLLEFPQYRGFGQGAFSKYAPFEAFLDERGVDPHDILVTSRVLMVALVTLAHLVSFYYSRRLFGFTIAILGFLLLAFDAFYIGVTRLAHLDGPMASFTLLSLLAFIAYLLDGRKRSDLLVSAIAGSLGFLSKLPALMLFPTLGVYALLDHYLWRTPVPGSTGDADRSFWRRLGKPLFQWVGVFVLVFILATPAIWHEPVKVIARMTVAPFRFVAELTAWPDGWQTWVSQQSDPSSCLPGSAPTPVLNDIDETMDELPIGSSFTQTVEYLHRYPEFYLHLASPVTLVGILLALLAWMLGWETSRRVAIRRAMFSISIFIIVYTLLVSIPPKTSSKYYLPVFPLMDLLAGIGWVALARRLACTLKPVIGIRLVTGVIVLAALAQAALAASTAPYYLTYVNPISRPRLAWGSGEGLDLAAAYLNAKPEAQDLRVLSWYGTGPFSYYFEGETVPMKIGGPAWEGKPPGELAQVDYLVTYNNQWIRDLPQGINSHLASIEPEYRVWLNGYEYARIYAVGDNLR